MSTDQIPPGCRHALTRRTFLSMLLLCTVGCQTRPPKVSLTPQPHPPSPSPRSLARDPGRLVVQSQGADETEPVASIWKIRADGTGQHLHDLPPDFVAPLERVGQGERICYYHPSFQEGDAVVVQTVEMVPGHQIRQRPDRSLSAFADPHLHFCDADLILASQPSDREPHSELVFIDPAGLVTSTSVDLHGVVEAIASDGQHVALMTSHVRLDGTLNYGALVLYTRQHNRLTEVARLLVPDLQNGGAFPTGLSLFRVGKVLSLSIGIEAGHSSASALLIYSLVRGELILQQRLPAESRPSPLRLANSGSAFYQNGIGQTFTYRWTPDGWEPVDEVRSTSFGASPQSQEPRGLVYLSNSAEQILCAQVDPQAQLGPPQSISESLWRNRDDENHNTRHVLMMVLD